MRSFLSSVFLLIFCSVLAQTGTLNGTISYSTKEPALGATVRILGTSLYTITSDGGKFEFKNLAYGEYTIEVSSMDSRPLQKKIALTVPTFTVNLTLKSADAQMLNSVTVQTTSAKKEIEDKGFAVTVIETQQAATRNLQTNDLLDRSVGVRLRQNGGLGSAVDYNLNGMSGNSVRIFINGIPASTYGSSFNLNSIPPALIDRIEIYKGVLPAHLADDALGGAINIIMKKSVRNSVSASASYGSFNTFQSNVNASVRRESGLTFKASAFYNYSDNDYKIWGDKVYNILPNGRRDFITARRFDDMYRSVGGRVEVGYSDVKWADRFFIGYNGSHDYNQIQHGQFMTRPYKGRFTNSDAHALSLNYSKRDILINGLDFNFNGVYSQRRQIVTDTVRWNYNWDGQQALGLYGDPILTTQGAQQGAPTLNHINRNIFSIRTGLDYHLGDNHKFIVNLMYNSVDRDERDEMKSELERRFLATRDMQKSVTSFAHEMTAFEKRVKTSLFAKYYAQTIEQRDPQLISEGGQQTIVTQKQKRSTDTWGYGLAASYRVISDFSVLLSAEKAVRMPVESEIFGEPGENLLPNPGLRPEISENVNLGLRFGQHTIGKHRITLSGSGFVRNVKDRIFRLTSARQNDAIQAIPFENLGRAQSIGFEVAADYSYDNRLFLSANVSRFNSLFKNRYGANGLPTLYYNRQLPNEPFFTANGSAQYKFSNLIQKDSELNLFYSCGYVDPFPTIWLVADNSSHTPPQFVNDFGISYTFPGKSLIASFDVRNMFNEQVFDNYAVQKPGRAFYFKLNYTLNKF